MALVGVEELAHRGQPRDVQAQEGHQIRTGEGSLRHVDLSDRFLLRDPQAPNGEGPLIEKTHP